MQVGETFDAGGLRRRWRFSSTFHFPSPDIFAKLPWQKEILEALLALDVIGLQTRRDMETGRAPSCIGFGKFPAGQQTARSLIQRDRANIEAIPIGIDFRAFAEQAASAPVRSAEQIKAKTHDSQITLGVDRLDYTKGIPYRLKAYAYALRSYPELHRKDQLDPDRRAQPRRVPG